MDWASVETAETASSASETSDWHGLSVFMIYRLP
jgi:hypothetical protein